MPSHKDALDLVDLGQFAALLQRIAQQDAEDGRHEGKDTELRGTILGQQPEPGEQAGKGRAAPSTETNPLKADAERRAAAK